MDKRSLIPARTFFGKSYKLYDEYNEFHLFVEDEGYEVLYQVLLDRLGFRAIKVFSLNGKSSVVARSRDCSDSKCLYLIDRDWDDSLGIPQEGCSRLAVLGCHSIENGLVDFQAFLGLVRAHKPRLVECSSFTEDAFNGKVVLVAERLKPLCIGFLALQRTSAGIKNSSRPPGYFSVLGKFPLLDSQKVSEYLAQNCPNPDSVSVRYFEGVELELYLHGKYLLHFVWAEVREFCGLPQMSLDSLRVRLAQLVSEDKLSLVGSAIISVLK